MINVGRAADMHGPGGGMFEREVQTLAARPAWSGFGRTDIASATRSYLTSVVGTRPIIS
ncbi:MAG: hypothetical protein INR65_02705 [Gluconacetobacter diazotrophicus]|nr:hypothetical protein [Gluconacetobacter diazotrophicus]